MSELTKADVERNLENFNVAKAERAIKALHSADVTVSGIPDGVCDAAREALKVIKGIISILKWIPFIPSGVLKSLEVVVTLLETILSTMCND